MKPGAHLLASAAVSVSIYYTTRSLVFAGVSFFAGFIIDIDHLIDFTREYGLSSDPRKLFKVFHETRFNKLFLWFHAWEWLIILFALSFIFEGNRVLPGLFAGMLHHLILDQCCNGVTPLGYSIVYRAVHQFSMPKIVTETIIRQKRSASCS